MIPGAFVCDVFPLPPIPSYGWIFGISGFVPCVGRTSDTSVFLCYLPRNGFRFWCADGMGVSLFLEDFLMFRFFFFWIGVTRETCFWFGWNTVFFCLLKVSLPFWHWLKIFLMTPSPRLDLT
jgi:hypothetical protein